MKLVYNVNDRPTAGKLVVFAIQQLLAIMAAETDTNLIARSDLDTARAVKEQVAEICECSTSHIGQIENGRVKPSLEMSIKIANALQTTLDHLLVQEYACPEKVYLKEIAERIEKYSVEKRILACEAFKVYLDSLERFSKK